MVALDHYPTIHCRRQKLPSDECAEAHAELDRLSDAVRSVIWPFGNQWCEPFVALDSRDVFVEPKARAEPCDTIVHVHVEIHPSAVHREMDRDPYRH